MKVLLLVLISIWSFLHGYQSLKATNICILSAECDDSNNCSRDQCLDREGFNYRCGLKGCTVNKVACDEYLSLGFLIRMKSFKNFQKNELSIYHSFFNKIENCSVLPYKWHADDMCLSRIDCFFKKRVAVNRSDSFFIRKTSCPCRGKYKYSCGKEHCAYSKQACSAFDSKDFKDEIKICENNVLSKTNFLNFKLRY